VDVDFPPIIQKEIFQYMQALEKLAAMMPSEVLEAKKLVVELALSVFGVNDVDKVLERIYPADMVGVLVPPAAAPAMVPGQPPFGGEDAPATVAESIADIRRRRLLQSVREAGAAVAGAG
jgi:copper chaperone CopZ